MIMTIGHFVSFEGARLDDVFLAFSVVSTGRFCFRFLTLVRVGLDDILVSVPVSGEIT